MNTKVLISGAIATLIALIAYDMFIKKMLPASYEEMYEEED